VSRIAKRVLYSGNVQGVGFRRRAESVARGFAVGGYVRNLPDGTVELHAEGEAAQVNAFLAGVAARLGREIDDAQVSTGAPAGLETFTIRQ
jgi:acylphosphatase